MARVAQPLLPSINRENLAWQERSFAPSGLETNRSQYDIIVNKPIALLTRL